MIVGKSFQPPQLFEITKDAVPDHLHHEVGQSWIGLKKPAAEIDAVGLVDDAVRIDGVELTKYRSPHQIGVESRHSIDLPRPNEGERAHADTTFTALVDQ